MQEEGRITNWQALLLILSTVLPTSAMGFLPALVYQEARQDAWLSVFPAVGFGLVAGLIVAALGMRFPGQTVVQYAEQMLGKILGKIIGLIYIVFFFFVTTIVLRTASEVFVNYFMPKTPILVFTISLALTAAYAIHHGLEVLARANEVLQPMVLIVAVSLTFLVLPEIKLDYLTPVLENGVVPLLRGAYVMTVYMGEVIVMLMMIPYLNQPGQAKKTITISMAVIAFAQFLATIIPVAILGTRLENTLFPAMSDARLISVGDVLQRFEPLIMLLWVAGLVMKIGIFYYCTVISAAQWLNLKKYQPLIWPLGALLIGLSMALWPNIIEVTIAINKVIIPYFMAIEVGVPLLLLLLAVWRGKGETCA